MIRTQGLTHVHLVVRDLDRSLRFYKDVFGMEERFRDGPLVVEGEGFQGIEHRLSVEEGPSVQEILHPELRPAGEDFGAINNGPKSCSLCFNRLLHEPVEK